MTSNSAVTPIPQPEELEGFQTPLESVSAAEPASALGPKGLSLRVNFSWTLAGNVVHAGCAWGILVVLAKLGSSEMVGQYALGLAVAAPVMALSMLKLRVLQATDAKREYAFGDYLRLRLVTTGLALVVICGIAWKAGYRVETALIVLAVGGYTAVESISDVIYGLLQQRERLDRVACSMMLKGPLALAAMAGVMVATGSVFWGVVAVAVARIMILVTYDVANAGWVLQLCCSASGEGGATGESIRPGWNLPTLANLAWLSLPMGLVAMLLSLYNNIPRYFIEHYRGESQLGIFAAIAYLMTVGTMVTGALGRSASPRLARYYAAGNLRGFRMLLLKLVGIGVVLGAAGVAVSLVAGHAILRIVYEPEYAEYTDVLVLVMLAAGILYVSVFLGFGMAAARYFRIQVPLNCLVVAASALLCWLLIPSGGLRGAAVALLTAFSMRLVGGIFIILHAVRSLARSAA